MNKITHPPRDIQGDAFLTRIDALLQAQREFNAFFNGNKIPAWLKEVRDTGLVMAYCNPAYTQATGIESPAYRNHSDKDLWDRATAEAFAATDHEVINKRRPVRMEEHATSAMNGDKQVWVGWKWPLLYKGDVIGVFGQASPWPADKFESFKAIAGDYL